MTTDMLSNDFELISDLHKDARGYRPSGDWLANFESLDLYDKQSVWDDLCDELAIEQEHEQRRQKAAIERFNKRIADIRSTVAGATVQDAIRYLHDAYDTRGDDGYLEYNLGVPYGHLRTL